MTQSDDQIKSVAERVDEVKKYFAPKAKDYDLVDHQVYWAFSDKLLRHLFEQIYITQIDEVAPIRVLDAGGGTARWTKWLLDRLPGSHITLVDVSPDMLSVAEEKIRRGNLTQRCSLHCLDLHEIDGHGLGQFDLIISLHNVLSFVVDPRETISKLSTMVKPGGHIVLVIPNHYHAAYFSATQSRPEELRRLMDSGKVKFTSSVPEMHTFFPEETRRSLIDMGAKSAESYGFPVTVYPEHAETEITGSGERAKSIFGDAALFSELDALEHRLCLRTEAAPRGNNLFVIAQF